MTDKELTELIARVGRLPDREIVRALATRSDYTLEAIVVYEHEAQRRGIGSEAVQPVAQQEAQRRTQKSARSWSISGIGQKLYGKRAFRVDGSYRTTKWFIFFHLPIYPIATFRVKPVSWRKRTVLEELPIDWRQAIDTYAFVALSWATFVFGSRWAERHSPQFSGWAPLVLFALPIVYLYVIRHRARSRARQADDLAPLSFRSSSTLNESGPDR